MLVEEVMNKDVKTIKPDATVRQAAEIMNKHGIGSLVVVDDSELKDIVTERDILRSVADGKGYDITFVKDIMTKDVITVYPNKNIDEAAELMAKNKIKKLPVVSGGALVGIVTASDLIAFEEKLLGKLSSLMVISKRTEIAG